MCTRPVVVGLVGALLASGCLSSRKAPFAADPTLLHYKPVLSDSATVMAEKAKRAEPTRPPSPAVAKNSLPEPQPVPRGPRSTDRLPDRIAESLPKPVATPVPEKSEPVPAPVPPSPVVPATATSQPKVETSFAIPPRVTETDPAKKNTDVPSAARTIPDPPRDFAAKSTATPPPPAKVASVKFEPPSPETSVFGHRVVAGKYGHAPDYTWLQGEADKHYRGYWTLRYRDPSEEDKYGGRVKLEGAIRLTEFEVGDIIGVRGEFVPNANPNQPPSFKVHNLWLVNKKQ
jgi:hypothetical protein